MISKLESYDFVSPRIVQAVLSTMLMFGIGSTFALSVFIPAVEAAADPPNSLNGVWEAAMGTMHFVSAPAMIIASVFLDGGTQHVVGSTHTPSFSFTTFRARLLCFISLLCYVCFALSAFGSAFSNSAFLFSGVALQGLPLAIGKIMLLSLVSAFEVLPLSFTNLILFEIVKLVLVVSFSQYILCVSKYPSLGSQSARALLWGAPRWPSVLEP